jgi:hypothetical protein
MLVMLVLIIMLCRVVYLGSVGRPLVTPDPAACKLLPSDDISWDQGVRIHLLPGNLLFNTHSLE